MTDLSITSIITAHREGAYLTAAVRSAEAAIARAEAAHPKWRHERLILLDSSDAPTREIAAATPGWHVEETELSDPGLSRNAAVEQTKTGCFAFLDGDDLWGDDWLAACISFQNELSSPAFLHAQYNLVFGREDALINQGPGPVLGYSLDYQRLANYWDALCFGMRETYLAHPMRENDRETGFAHEDQEWALRTMALGLVHYVVPGTIHFKRRRAASISVMAASNRSRGHRSREMLWPREGE